MNSATPGWIQAYPYQADNMYLNMLYLAPRAAGWRLNSIKVLASFVKQLERFGADDLVHVHWTSAIVQEADSPSQSAEQLAAFKSGIDGALARGASLIWTVHDKTLSGCRYPEQELELIRFLVDRADEVHVLSKEAEIELGNHFDNSAAKFCYPRHASFAGICDDSRLRSEARGRWDFADEDTVVLVPTRDCSHSDVESLCESIQRASIDAARIVLLIATNLSPTEIARMALHNTANVRVIVSEVKSDHELAQHLFAAADVVAFPSIAEPTLDEVRLAVTFGVCAILPRSDYLRRYFGAERWAQFFDEIDNNRQFASLIADFRRNSSIRDAALAFAREFTPYDMSRAFLARL